MKLKTHILVVCFIAWPVAMCTGATQRPVNGIMDNSFLVEEAYNQEAGVVQHISTAQYSKNRSSGDSAWNFSFTQEWPAPNQTHQLSYTIPYSSRRSTGETQSGFGDILINYRYQAYFNEDSLTAFAPRLSAVLPTGNSDRGFGDDTVGAQINLPFSTTVGDHWFVHTNIGTTYLPQSKAADKTDLQHYSAGVSVIFAASPTTHFMLECVANWNEERSPSGRVTRPPVTVISPGVRHAFNLPRNLQIVAGLAAPIGLSSAADDYGVFLYLSIEHPFSRTPSEKR